MTDWLSVAVDGVVAAGSVAAWFTLNGRFHQKVEDLSEKFKAHDAEIIAMRTIMSSVQASTDRIVEKIDNQKALWGLEIKGLTEQVKAGQELLNAKLEGGDRLAAREMEQVKHDLRQVTQQIERLPHPRRRSTAD